MNKRDGIECIEDSWIFNYTISKRKKREKEEENEHLGGGWFSIQKGDGLG